ncbi:MAG TPA: UDP-N-acetylmuramoyl-L-alanine--D-glutamate ligase [Candidatus Borkfalkia excrementigallinarum]|uniref:UDP-N-acetylmuramoylalanine--D-glutamate ligase n=1 Tax=Candidatus Borkfalkia excrementigallinarum TaxID=2838506 RepID=A0A9D1ZXJ0_9FIRM|nr:UDP-N-acetylmuramoyl-L-alanine--D-glutamate ligase [Candidatus Borkfalkia excrementigallinarum]
MYFKNQKFLVAGMSKSGIAGTEFLLSRGAAVCMYDDVTGGAVRSAMDKLAERGAVPVRAEQLSSAVEECDILVLSPGIPIDHELPVAFRKAGKRIVGESELGCLYLRAALVAVTGTNGKTTTVTMIDEILRAAGLNSIACGNIGLPLSACVDTLGYDDVAVMEVSSFQLETLTSVRPHVAVVTNITEDHLNRHYSMENYIFLKSKILRNMRESEYAVLNFDDENVRAMAHEARCRVRWFSLRERAEGAYLFDGGLYFENEKIMNVSDLSLKGEHNVKNALAAICAAKLMGVESSVIAKTLSSMRGVRHRMETVAQIGGVTYINDSKGTNVDATLNAVACMQSDTVLLLGGKDKGYDYDKLFQKLKDSRVVQAVLYGENRFKLLNAAARCNESRITLCADFSLAVKIAAMTARPGQCVLLSPASSSFDEFAGYEERGERFEEIVRSLKEEGGEIDELRCGG